MIKGFIDSLTNVAVGLGRFFGGRSTMALSLKLQAECEVAYRQSWLARKIHDIPPYDMTRAWRHWQTDKDKIQAIEAEETRLKLSHKCRRALLLARLYGGGALILGLPGNPDEEVKPDQVKKGGLAYIHVVSRHQLHVADLQRDILNPFFNQPTAYRISGTATDIHPSRVIPFIGQPLPEGLLSGSIENFWGDPLLQSLADVVENSEAAQQAIADLLKEAKIDIIKIPDLMNLVGNAEYEQRLIKRLTIAQTIKSTSNALLISGPASEGQPGEEWEMRQVNFAGLPDLAKVFLLTASGGADIPATRLLGQSPDGMNATGESDLRNYYDMISSRQQSDLRPTISPLDEFLLCSALGGIPSDVHYEWASLWQLTPEQKADTGLKKAQAIKIYSDASLVPSRALEEGAQNMLIEDAMLPGLESALEAMTEEERFPPPPDPAELAAAAAAATATQPGQAAARAAPPPQPRPKVRAANDQRFTDASPRTLYVSRQVMNAAAIIAHFKDQGLETMLPPADMHVTIAFSRTPVDWMAISAEWSREPNGHLTIAAGGARLVERLGDKGALVLLFASLDLSWRHADILRNGASWDWPEYQPHITLTYQPPEGLDLEEIEPWRGVIELGPEIFEEVVDDWEVDLEEQ